ncbi:MAG: WD40 repeat domain-containing protein [Cyanophyceae cyanobacterium]
MSSPINSPQDRYCQFHATFSLPSHCAPSPGNGGHGGVRSLALSPHQQWLASGGDDGRVAIHSTKKLQERAEFDAASEIMPAYNVGSDWVRAIAVAPSGQWWVCGSNDGSLRVFWWCDRQWKPCQLVARAHGFWVMAVVITPDGKTVISAGADNRVQAWRVEHHELGITLVPTWSGSRHTFWVSGLALTAEGGTVASVGYDGQLALWDVEQGEEIRHWQAHSGYCSSVACAPNGKTIATGGADRLIYLWDFETGHCRATLSGNGGNVFGLEFHPDAHTLYSSGSDGTIRAWETESGKFSRFIGLSNCPWALAIAPDGRWLAVAGADEYIRRWSLPDGQDLGAIATDGEQLPGLAITPDGQTLWVGGNHGEIRAIALPPTPTAVTFTAIHGHCDGRVRGIAWHKSNANNHKYELWTGGDDGFVRRWQVSPNLPDSPAAPQVSTDIQVHPLNAWHTDTLWVMAIARASLPGSKWIASGGTDQFVTLWSLDGQPLQQLRGHTGWISALAIAPDDSWLVSASHDGTLRQWNCNTGKCLRTLTPPTGSILETVAIDPAAHWIATGSDRHVYLWNAHTGILSATFTGHTRAITHLHFADGYLISSSLDSTVRWWNVETLQCDQQIKTQVPAIATQTLPSNQLITAPAWGGHLELFSPSPN